MDIIDKTTKKFNSAYKDVSECVSIIDRLISDNQERIQRAALIADRYNDVPPYDQKKIAASGEKWRSNFSTGFLSSLVKRVVPNYKRILDSLESITLASIDNEAKNAKIREKFTETVRRWSGWEGFTTKFILENVLYGYCSIAYINDMDWRPIAWRCDEAIFPNNVPQKSEHVPLFAIKQNFLIHELADKFNDIEASEAAGWNIANLIESINNAKSASINSSMEDQRRFTDLTREGDITMSNSYMSGVKEIECYHFYISEPGSGHISYLLIDYRSKKALFERKNAYESMSDVLVLFTIEEGNSKLHGSKGLGRVLYNIAMAAEYVRNNIIDNSFLSGLLLLKRQNANRKDAALSVAHPVALLGEGFDVADATIPANTKDFLQLDAQILRIAELLVGAFIPGQILDSNNQPRTATEVNYVASVEAQMKVGVLARFLSQFMELVYLMQKRFFSQANIEQAIMIRKINIGNVNEKVVKFKNKLSVINPEIYKEEEIIEKPYVTDEKAIEVLVELLDEGILPHELYEFGLCPPMAVKPTDQQAELQSLLSAYNLFANNPQIRSQRFLEMIMASMIGTDKAEELILPAEVDDTRNEQARLQLMEITSLVQGEPIPVSERDDHKVHMDILMAKSNNFLQQSIDKNIAEMLIKHFNAHLQEEIKNGNKDIKIYEDFANTINNYFVGAQNV